MIDRYFQIILIISSLAFLLFIIFMIKNKSLQLKYSLLWFVLSSFFIIISFFPKIGAKLAALLHVETPSNALFLGILAIVIIILFSLTITLSKLIKQIVNLTQQVALLENELKLKETKKN